MTRLQESPSEQLARTAEATIARAVRDWTETVIPGDQGAADAAAAFALGSFAAGASPTDACEQARTMVVCRSHHPSRLPAVRRLHLAAVS